MDAVQSLTNQATRRAGKEIAKWLNFRILLRQFGDFRMWLKSFCLRQVRRQVHAKIAQGTVSRRIRGDIALAHPVPQAVAQVRAQHRMVVRQRNSQGGGRIFQLTGRRINMCRGVSLSNFCR